MIPCLELGPDQRSQTPTLHLLSSFSTDLSIHFLEAAEVGLKWSK